MSNGKMTIAVLHNQFCNIKDDVNNIGFKVEKINEKCNEHAIEAECFKNDIKMIKSNQAFLTALVILSILTPIALFCFQMVFKK